MRRASGYRQSSYHGSFAVAIEVMGYCPRTADAHVVVRNLEKIRRLRLSSGEENVVSALAELRRLATEGV